MDPLQWIRTKYDKTYVNHLKFLHSLRFDNNEINAGKNNYPFGLRVAEIGLHIPEKKLDELRNTSI